MKKVFLWVLISALFNAQIASPVTSTDLRKRAAWAAHLWVLLAARIFVHETGHAIAAKAIGAKVESINLGWSETEPYITVCDTFFLRNLIPLAGYCKVSSREPLSPGNQLFFASAGVLAEVAVTLGIYGSSKIFGFKVDKDIYLMTLLSALENYIPHYRNGLLPSFSEGQPNDGMLMLQAIRAMWKKEDIGGKKKDDMVQIGEFNLSREKLLEYYREKIVIDKRQVERFLAKADRLAAA